MGKFKDYVLGGATTPMAGDGYGGAQVRRSSKGSPSPITGAGEYTTSNASMAAYLTISQHAFPVKMDDEREDGNEQQLASKGSPLQPVQLPHGIRVTPASSMSTLIARTIPAPSVRSSLESFRTTSEQPLVSANSELPTSLYQVPWQDHQIPEELAVINDDTPKVIRDIVQESIDEHRAMQASRMQSCAFSVQTSFKSSDNACNSGGLVVAESSVAASASSTPTGEASIRSVGIPIGSDAIEKPDSDSCKHLKPPSHALDRPTVVHSQESSRVHEKSDRVMTEIERNSQECKPQSHRSHKLFSLMPHRRSKGRSASELPKAEPAMVECTGCLDDFPNTECIRLLCRHEYCSHCFTQLITTSIQNEASYPPKCCLTEIPKKTIRDNLPPSMSTRFEKKALEYAVPVGSRFYCVSTGCGKWIDTRHAKRAKGTLRCPHCSTKLCTLCRGPQHPSNEDCPQDLNLNRTLQHAERAGWRRCYNCRAMVELNTGCRHITCQCRAEFCYTCGAVWHTCRCTEADQERRDQETRTRSVQYEADQRAQEEELRAATQAVVAAERLLREERQAEERRMEEEARELQSQEAERVQNIAAYFEYLHGTLVRLCLEQRSAIDARHACEREAIDKMKENLDSVAKADKREAQVKSERNVIIASTETRIKAFNRQHGAVMMQAIVRHREEQGMLLTQSVEGEDQDAEILHVGELEKLRLAQALELATLKSEQAHEIQTWEQRGKASLQAFDSQRLVVQMRLEEAEIIDKQELDVRNAMAADDKWSDFLLEERLTMLAEDKETMVRNGAEAPAIPERQAAVTLTKQMSAPDLLKAVTKSKVDKLA